MTQRDLNQEWVWTQLEAWADGSLSSESRQRMEAAIAADSRLRAAAERAFAVHRALRASVPPPMPRGLRLRLLAIPRRSNAGRSFALPALASAAAAVAVVAVAIWLRPEAPVQPDERTAAAQEATREAAEEMEIAMRYLQKSARVTQGHVTSAVGSGLRDAFAASRAALASDSDETGG
jgi:ferric-dicitrate binding protein FerR (iron transport regulator)